MLGTSLDIIRLAVRADGIRPRIHIIADSQALYTRGILQAVILQLDVYLICDAALIFFLQVFGFAAKGASF